MLGQWATVMPCRQSSVHAKSLRQLALGYKMPTITTVAGAQAAKAAAKAAVKGLESSKMAPIPLLQRLLWDGSNPQKVWRSAPIVSLTTQKWASVVSCRVEGQTGSMQERFAAVQHCVVGDLCF